MPKPVVIRNSDGAHDALEGGPSARLHGICLRRVGRPASAQKPAAANLPGPQGSRKIIQFLGEDAPVISRPTSTATERAGPWLLGFSGHAGLSSSAGT